MEALVRTMLKTHSVVRTGSAGSETLIDLAVLLRHQKSSAQALAAYVAALSNGRESTFGCHSS